MLNFLYATPSDIDILKMQILLDAIEQRKDKLIACPTLDAKKGALLGLIAALPEGHYKPSQVQVNTMLKALEPHAQITTEHLKSALLEQGKHLHPSAYHSIHIALVLGALYFTPELFACFALKALLSSLLESHIGKLGTAGVEALVMLVPYMMGYQLNPVSLMDNLLPSAIAERNLFLRMPFHMVIRAPIERAVSYTGSALCNLGSGLYQAGRFFSDFVGLTEPQTPYMLGYMHQDSEYAEENMWDELFDEKPALTKQFALASSQQAITSDGSVQTLVSTDAAQKSSTLTTV